MICSSVAPRLSATITTRQSAANRLALHARGYTFTIFSTCVFFSEIALAISRIDIPALFFRFNCNHGADRGNDPSPRSIVLYSCSAV